MIAGTNSKIIDKFSESYIVLLKVIVNLREYSKKLNKMSELKVLSVVI